MAPTQILELFSDQLQGRSTRDIVKQAEVSPSTVRRLRRGEVFDPRSSVLFPIAGCIDIEIHAYGSQQPVLTGFIAGLNGYLRSRHLSIAKLARLVGSDRTYLKRVLAGKAQVGLWLMHRLSVRTRGNLHARLTPRRAPRAGGSTEYVYPPTAAIRSTGEVTGCSLPCGQSGCDGRPMQAT